MRERDDVGHHRLDALRLPRDVQVLPNEHALEGSLGWIGGRTWERARRRDVSAGTRRHRARCAALRAGQREHVDSRNLLGEIGESDERHERAGRGERRRQLLLTERETLEPLVGPPRGDGTVERRSCTRRGRRPSRQARDGRSSRARRTTPQLGEASHGLEYPQSVVPEVRPLHALELVAVAERVRTLVRTTAPDLERGASGGQEPVRALGRRSLRDSAQPLQRHLRADVGLASRPAEPRLRIGTHCHAVPCGVDDASSKTSLQRFLHARVAGAPEAQHHVGDGVGVAQQRMPVRFRLGAVKPLEGLEPPLGVLVRQHLIEQRLDPQARRPREPPCPRAGSGGWE